MSKNLKNLLIAFIGILICGFCFYFGVLSVKKSLGATSEYRILKDDGGGYIVPTQTTDIIGSSTVNSYWRHSTTTNDIYFSSLTNCDTIDTDANGLLSCGTDTNGGTVAQLGQIGDVSTSTLAWGHLLMHDGTNWQDTATSSLGFLAFSGLTGNSLTKGYFLVGDDANLSQATSSIFVSSTGNIGIGTTLPDVKFHIYDADNDTRLRIETGKVNGVAALRYTNDARTYSTRIDASDRFQIRDVTENLARLTIDTNGNIGIGTTSPYAKLSVDGDIVMNSFNATSTTATSTIKTGLSLPNIVDFYLNKTIKFFADVVADFTLVAKLLIPYSTNPTMDTAGQMALNSTAASSSVRYFDGTAERALYPDYDSAFSFASSTLTYMGAYGTTGTTTILLANYSRPTTLIKFYCKTNIGTAWVGFGNGTASTTQTNCSTAGVEITPAANNTWTMRENFYIEIGTQTSNPSNISITATLRKDAD